jgi:hypothetical protein
VYVIFPPKKRNSLSPTDLLESQFQVTMARQVRRMMRNWRSRLTPLQQRIYDRSASIPSIQLSPTPKLQESAKALESALAADDQSQVEALAQTIVNQICWRLSVRTVQVQVLGVRPSNRRGELHGLYTQYNGGSRNDCIQVWMRTAKRGQVVAFRTFLRTLLHEVCHHLDYTHLHLRESYHTEGFFQRESSLFRVIMTQPEAEEARPAPSLSAMVKEILAEREGTIQGKNNA